MPPLAIAAAIGGVASIGGAAISSSAASKAASSEATASKYATDQNLALQKSQYDQTRSDQAPYRATGYSALDRLGSRFGLNTAPAATTAAQGSGGIDYNALFQQRPDVAAAAQQAVQSGAVPNVNAFADQWAQTRPPQDTQAIPQVGDQSASQAPQSQVTNGGQANPLIGDNLSIADRTPYAARPDVGTRPTTTRPDQGARTDLTAPTYARPDQGTRTDLTRTDLSRAADPGRPVVTRPDTPALDVSVNAFQNSNPGYQFQQDEAARGVLSKYSSISGLDSGAALKALSDQQENIANQSYNAFRDYATQQYNTTNARTDSNFQYDSGRSDSNYSQDRSRNDSIYTQDQGRADANYTQDQGRADTNFTADRNNANTNFESDRGYGTNAFNTAQTRADTNYTQDRTNANQNFESDRTAGNQVYDANAARSDANYASDRGYANDIYTGDRAYTTGRFDTGTNNYFTLAGLGTAANSATASAGQNYANQAGQAYYNQAQGQTAAAQTQANGVLAGVGQVNSLVGQGLNAYGLYSGGAYGQTNRNAFSSNYLFPTQTNPGYTGANVTGLY